MNLTENDRKEVFENIKFKNGSIDISLDTTTNRNFLAYIEDFCNENKIHYKYVGEGITIYPEDFSKLNKSRIDTSNVFVSLLAWNEESNYDEDEECYPITNIYWVDVEKDINSFKDFETLLLEIHNTKQVKEAYYTQDEIDEIESERELQKQKNIKREDKRKNKFSKKCKKLNVSEEDFMILLEAYKESNNKYNWI